LFIDGGLRPPNPPSVGLFLRFARKRVVFMVVGYRPPNPPPVADKIFKPIDIHPSKKGRFVSLTGKRPVLLSGMIWTAAFAGASALSMIL
jgi:hypothetical protein